MPADAAFSQGYVDCYRDIAMHGVKAFRVIFAHVRDHPDQAVCVSLHGGEGSDGRADGADAEAVRGGGRGRGVGL